MRTATLSYARANLAKTWDSVIDDAEPVVLTRAGHSPVVLLGLAEYESMRETLYLKRSPVMAARIDSAIAKFDQGQGFERELVEA